MTWWRGGRAGGRGPWVSRGQVCSATRSRGPHSPGELLSEALRLGTLGGHCPGPSSPSAALGTHRSPQGRAGAAQARPHSPHPAESGFASTSFCPCSCEMEAGEAILSLCSPVTVRSWTSCLIILAFSPPPAPRQATSQQTSVLPTNFLRPVLRLREVK